MKLHILAASAAAAMIVSPAVAVAQVEQGRWSLSLEAGADFPVDGELNGGRHVAIPDLGVADPLFAGAGPFIFHVNPVEYEDVYDTSWAVGGEIGYGLSDNAEVFGTLRYTSASGGGVPFGRLQNVTTVEVSEVTADFDDHEVWTLDVGYRHYFGEGPRWKPYLAGRVGAAYTSGISASFAGSNGFAVNDVTFYDDSWSWTFGGDLGVNYQASDRFAIQAEVGLRYISDLSDESGPGLVNLGLSDLNSDSGASISAPLMIRGKYTW